MAVELNPEITKGLKDALTRGLRRVLSGDPGNTISGEPVPDFLAGPAPNNPLGAFQHRSGRAVCDRWARGERATLLPSRDAYLRQLCEPYLGSGMPGAPETGPQFEGGQCGIDGGGYFVTVDFTDKFGTSESAQRRMRGPIGKAEFVETTADGTQGRLEVIGHDATPNTNCGIPLPDRGRQPFAFTGVLTRYGRGSRVDNVTVVPCPGYPNNCGDIPPDFDSGAPNPSPDPNPGPVGGPTGYPFPDLDITIGPDGDIFIDFGDGEPPTEIDPTDPDPAPSSGVNTEPGSPGAVGETGDGGTTEGEADEGEELTGVLVRVLSAHENANKVDRSPVDVFRGIGYVAMGFPGLLGVDTSAAVVESPQFFHAQQRGLTAWRVRANVGFNLETTPYYREIEE